jgi:hypothetical protein
MERPYNWKWVEEQVAQSIEEWAACGVCSLPAVPHYTLSEQRRREKAYDEGLRVAEREARKAPRTLSGRSQAQQRIVGAFPRFAASALGLESDAVELLTGSFMPVGSQLARWTRNFDPSLSMADTIQACRNAWIACGAQALLGQPMELTPSTLAYSLLYPYSDNYLDQPELPAAQKHLFSERFRQRLLGRQLPARNPREAAIWTMVQMIEEQYPRPLFPQVYDCLLAIHQAQEQSIKQLAGSGLENARDPFEVLRISCAKGGSSVVADACLAHPWLTAEESRFAFDWGVLLQLGDDLQDVREDLRRGSVTLFTRAAAQGKPLDSLVVQLFNLSEQVASRMDRLPNGTPSLKNLLRTSWRMLILMAVAEAQPFFSSAFLAELEPCSSFRFNFVRTRNKKLAGRRALYATLFDAFLEAGSNDRSEVPQPGESALAPGLLPAAELCALSGAFS